MNHKWARVKKSYRGGSYKDWVFIPGWAADDDDEIKAILESWAARSSGGHNYGYRVSWEMGLMPDAEYLLKEIAREEARIKNSKVFIGILRKDLERV